jgi:hypothetical protein
LENWGSRRKFYQKFKTHPKKTDFRSEFYPGKNVGSNTSNLKAKYTRRKLLLFMNFRSEFNPGKNVGSNTSNLQAKYIQ